MKLSARVAQGLLAAVLAVAGLSPNAMAQAPACARTITANVVALDQPLMYNRIGAQNINGMMFALRRDVVDTLTNRSEIAGGVLRPGQVQLREDKRPRPLVLRVAAGDCLTVNFLNLLSPVANPRNARHPAMHIDDQVASRHAGFQVQGLSLLGSIASDSSNVGRNPSSLTAPGEQKTYRFYAPKEGTFLVVSHGAQFGGEAGAGNNGNGLFAVVNVQPLKARFYRSQVTELEMRLATTGKTTSGHPVINYEAKYPNAQPWIAEGKAGLPVLNMLTAANELVHSDISAVIMGPNNDGSFPASTYPLEATGKRNPAYPNRLDAFREFTIAFHDEAVVAQAFPGYFNDPVLKHTLSGVRDAFGINYGITSAGSEVLANRLGVGPMHDCANCAFEEFFLSAFAVGDPAMLVDVPANVGLESVRPGEIPPASAVGPKATRAYYPDDPSNVRHSYLNDFVKFRNVHAGWEYHVFHLHAHQWLFNPNDDNSSYLDAQSVGPGSAYTYEIAFGGSGNRNRTPGDSIYHCHFYPHFAMGMWELWRTHDTFQSGTRLKVTGAGTHATPWALKDGTPAQGARALPDGEIVAGTPIPGLVPLPGKAMAPIPGAVTVEPKVVNGKTVGSVAKVLDRTINPGFPFYIAGIESIVGQRGTTPPLDMLASAGGFDGGLPRHSLEGYAAGAETQVNTTRLDMTKQVHKAKPVYFPEEGTDMEKVAMAFHGRRSHPSTALLPNGTTRVAEFLTNGAPAAPGAPYADPCVDDRGTRLGKGVLGEFFDGAGGVGYRRSSVFNADSPRIYKNAAVQFDAVLNKMGQHFPQQRIYTLWEDAVPTINKQKAPEPLTMRANSMDCVQLLAVNLLPENYELDDYQVRTTTDKIGQHIHLVKFDVTAADGAANGWNYEDGTLAPGAVRERIHAINAWNDAHPDQQVRLPNGNARLEALPHPFFGQYGKPEWLGARTTIQRWFADPVINTAGKDRGLGTVFSHDHYGPSTHQQVGLYTALLIEPQNSRWVHNETGEPMFTRHDGGPTSWQAVVLAGDLDGDGKDDSYREFFLEFSDFQHAYEKDVYVGVGPDGRTPAPATADSYRYAVNPPIMIETKPVFPDLRRAAPSCPGGMPRPCPGVISLNDIGTFVVNYRNEPVGFRIYDPRRIGPDGKPGMQTSGLAGDLAFALQTRIDRALPQLNTVVGDTPYLPLTNDVRAGDPFTPILRAHSGDRVSIKTVVGGWEETHNASVHGLKWLHTGGDFGVQSPNSGWKNHQFMGISEHFPFLTPVIADSTQNGKTADYAWTMDASTDGWWTGVWGVMRNYSKRQDNLFPLPANPRPVVLKANGDLRGTCPKTATIRRYDITAVLANKALSRPAGVSIVPADGTAALTAGAPLDPNGGTLVYNPRDTQIPARTILVEDPLLGEVPHQIAAKQGPLHDPTAVLYLRTADLDASGRLKPGIPVEPLVMRAAAGECVEVTLRNRLPAAMPDLPGHAQTVAAVVRDRHSAEGTTYFQLNLAQTSSHVGMHTQLLEYDVSSSDGTNVGINPVQTVAPGQSRMYQWYAGDLRQIPTTRAQLDPDRDETQLQATPVEFGGVNIIPADKIKQGQKGMVGALVVLPPKSTWVEDADRRSSATVRAGTKTFRDHALVHQKGMNFRYRDGTAVGKTQLSDDPQDIGQFGVNYRSEPMWFRFGMHPESSLGHDGFGGVATAWQGFSNACCAASGPAAGSVVNADPVTPVLTSVRGAENRMRLLMPHGLARGSVWSLHGHLWQQDPYLSGTVASQSIGNNPLGIWRGQQDGILPYASYNVVLPKAGGDAAIPGDYLMRDYAPNGTLSGMWGIFRVQ